MKRGGRAIALAIAAGLMLSGCGLNGNGRTSDGRIVAVGAESQYADVIKQVGGRYVAVTSILDNPATDPHTFEASPSIAREISQAALIVQNGLGYDGFMNQLEQATSTASRRVVTVQSLLGKPDSTPNPHLWYDPATMPRVAREIAAQLGAIDPSHRSYFAANAARFVTSLTTWRTALATVASQHPGARVATTEPVADYLIEAAGLTNVTPWSFQEAVMKGSDPSPQDVATLQHLFKAHQATVFIYNQQVTDSLTTSFASLAKANRIPIVGVYEIMPTPGYDYQSWMVAETNAILAALTSGKSSRL